MEKTEALLTKMYGELHELVGDHQEFKRQTVERLRSLESAVKNAPSEQRAKICSFISALSALAALAGALGIGIGGIR